MLSPTEGQADAKVEILIICRPQAGRYLRLRIRLEWYVGGSFEGDSHKGMQVR